MNDKTALVNVLKNRSVLMGTDVAYIFITATGETKITYSELDARARVVAGMLQEYCAYKERVLLLLEPGLDYIVALWGCLYAGAIAIPAYQPRNSHHMQRLEAIIEDSKAAFVFKAKTTLADFSFPIKELFLDQITAEYQEVSISLNDIAFLQYTSGSTDKPKGVIVSHGNIVANLNTLNHLLSPILNPQNVGCSWLPPYHDMGLIGGILLPIYIGFPMFLMSPLRFVQSPFSWLKLISDKKIDIGVAPNFAYEMCVNNISDTEMLDLDLSSCKALFNASEPIVVESVQSFIDKFSKVGLKTSAILPAYGMAEATLIISGIMATTKFSTVNLVKDDFQKGIVTRCTNSNQNSVKKIGCGKPDIFHNILIVDPSSNSILPPDSIGEICFSGPSVAQGYWRQDKLTKAVFKNYFLNDSISYLRSGDLGFLDSNNELYVIGRIKEVVIINGRNIYPHDICMSISYSHSSLVKHSSAVFGIEINGKEQLIIIQEIKRHIEHYSDIFEAILNKVALEYEVIPAQILLIGAAQLPKTSSGKIQHLAAKTAFLNKELKIITKWIPQSIDEQRKNNGFTLPVVPPSSIDQIYKGLANYIADYYNLDSNLIEKDRSFIYFGCDSIMITIFAADISKWLNIEIIPPEIWENNSLSKLTSYIGIKLSIVEMENPNHPTIEKNFIDNSVCSTRTDFKSMVGFDKYPGYVELKQLQAEFTQEGFEDIYFRLNSGTSTNTTMIDGRSYINYSGYNYLGLSGNSRVIEAVYAAIKENGTSASASRLASGEKPLHRELESLIAGILNVQDALVFSSGHATNVYTITSLFGAKDLIIHDALVHNSLQQGAIYSGAMRLVFPHNDYSALEAILATYRDKYERVLIITEGVFSMDGDIPNILKLIEIKKRYFAYLMVDEAHSMGVIGDRGLGVRELFNLNSNDIDIWMGTLSKSFASCGGYIAGSKELIEYIKYRSGGFIFSAAISPSNTAAAIEAIKILLEEPWRVRKIQDNAKLFLSILKDNKVDIGLSNGSPIIPIIVNKDINALKLSKALYSKCILAMPIIYPAVEKNFARVRLFINCLHTEEQIHQSAEIIIDEYHKLFK